MTQKQNMGLSRFITFWILAHIVGWITMWLASATIGGMFLGTVIHDLSIALGIGIVLTLIQKWLIERRYNLTLKHWNPLSLLGWLLGGVAGHFVFMTGIQSLMVYFTFVFAVPSIMQAWLMRDYVRGSWVWGVAGGVSGMLMTTQLGVPANVMIVLLMSVMALLVQSLVTGLSAVWLFDNNDRRKSKRKNEADDTLFDKAKHRLEEGDDSEDWQDDDDAAGRLQQIIYTFLRWLTGKEDYDAVS